MARLYNSAITDQAKQTIIAPRSARDQPCKSQQAISRRQDKSLQLNPQLSDFEQQLFVVQGELQEMIQQEKAFIVQITNGSLSASQQNTAGEQSNNDVFLQLQAQFKLMQ